MEMKRNVGGIDACLRAEMLSVADFVRLANALSREKPETSAD